MTFKRLSALLLAVVMLVSLAACGDKNTPAVDEGSAWEDTVVIGYLAELDSADPYGSTSAECWCTTTLTHDFLALNNPVTGELDPVLAESWKDVNGDGLVWQINLKKGVKFHNGEEMTAEDVKFTWERIAPSAGAVVKQISAADYTTSVDIIDDYTVQFNLKSAMYDFPTYLDIKLYNKDAFDSMDPAEAALVGNGPYMYDKELYKSGVQFGFTKFADYYDSESHPTNHIVFRYIPEEDARVAALQAHEIDVLYFDNASYFSVLDADPEITTYKAEGAQSYYIGFNFANPIFSDVRLRQAICMGINRADVEAVYFENGLGGKAMDNFCVPSGIGYNKDVHALGYDPEGAKALLKELGYDGNLSLTLAYNSVFNKLNEVVQANLAEVGIKVTTTQIDVSNWGAFKSGREGFDIYPDYGSYTGAMLYNYNRFFQENGSSNFTGFFDQGFEDLLNYVLEAPSYDDMLTRFVEMQQYVADQVFLVPLGINYSKGATLSDVQGYQLGTTHNMTNFSTVCIPKR